ncbi:sensor histidine kinase [Actinomadura verrucosospora]|uniref:Putative anti-sigma regulatory factor n=1 Tax=Actinomadura verrucosospora TaxID=46165 RepID=A0A7D3VY05_ACTVE|nr:sensor histidine kinase [Actinomadura verrucosospora]QKG25450.1 putative anti-sigma regulatory factor [Actinomadura verrucosospora]
MIAYPGGPPETAAAAPAAVRPDGRRDALVHRAIPYGWPRELALTAVPFLRGGWRAGDAVVVIASEPVRVTLREELGVEVCAGIEFIDSGEWFGGPMRALAGYHDRMRADWWPRGGLRLLAEPVWDGLSPLETREWQRHESLLNVVFAGTPTTIMCAYDAVALPPDVLDAMARTHPELAGPDGPRPSPRFTDPAEFYAECNAGALPPPPDAAAHRTFGPGGLPSLRAFLTVEAMRLGLPESRTLPFVLAANEVATLIIRTGGGCGSARLWTREGELVCEVADPGRALADRFLGYAPPRGPGPAAGPDGRDADGAMWAVRRLCRLVQIRSGTDGTRIRMHVRLDGE